jgi:capsular polysaccharide export protein
LVRPLRIMLLQGPVGGFFTALQRQLTASGFHTRRLVFNAGDAVFALGVPVDVVRVPPDAYPEYFRREFTAWGPDAVILFGDERPVHKVAIAAAKAAEIPVWCFEEGYVRPYHVAFELSGNNANSPTRLGFDPAVRYPQPWPVTPTRRPTVSMGLRAMAYFASLGAGRWAFPGYVHHRQRRLALEVRVWLRSFARHLRHRRRDPQRIDQLTANAKARYFVVALQVHDDLQLRQHGCGWRTTAFLETVLRSFAQQAPRETQLVIKFHPLDLGYNAAISTARTLSAALGLADRVLLIYAAPVAPLIKSAAGVVTVNSTVGLQALRAGVPTLALGEAIYHVEGLPPRATSAAELDTFWSQPQDVDRDVAENFARCLFETSLLEGSFYLKETWPHLIAQVRQRLTHHAVAVAGVGNRLPPSGATTSAMLSPPAHAAKGGDGA